MSIGSRRAASGAGLLGGERAGAATPSAVELRGRETAGELLRHAGREGRGRGRGRPPALVREARVHDAPVAWGTAARTTRPRSASRSTSRVTPLLLSRSARADVRHAQALLRRLAETQRAGRPPRAGCRARRPGAPRAWPCMVSAAPVSPSHRSSAARSRCVRSGALRCLSLRLPCLVSTHVSDEIVSDRTIAEYCNSVSEATMNIAIIGAGNVGKALTGSAIRAGHSVTVSSTSGDSARAAAEATGARAAASNREAVEGADLVVLAVPYAAVDDVLGEDRRGARRQGRSSTRPIRSSPTTPGSPPTAPPAPRRSRARRRERAS